MYNDTERAKSSVSLPNGTGKKSIKQIFKQQFRLTAIQYLISFLVFILGVYFYKCLNNMMLSVGSITIKDVYIQNLNINMGTILILTSLYMIVKITLNLNIKINKGEN